MGSLRLAELADPAASHDPGPDRPLDPDPRRAGPVQRLQRPARPGRRDPQPDRRGDGHPRERAEPGLQHAAGEPGRRPETNARRQVRRTRGLGDRPADRGAGHVRARAAVEARELAVGLRPAGDLGPGHRRPHRTSTAPCSRGRSRRRAKAGSSTPDDKGKPNIVISRKIARDFPDAARPAREGRRHPPDRRQDVHDHRHLRDRLDAPGRRRSSWTSRRPGPSLNFAKDSISSIYVEADDPGAVRRPSARRSRRPIPASTPASMNEVQANFGSLMGQVDKLLMMTVSLALAGGDRGDHQHHADEHDRAVRRVRRAPDQRLVGGQHPDAGDARERVPRAARRESSAASWP